jgi:hypothetical protein
MFALAKHRYICVTYIRPGNILQQLAASCSRSG